jgi:hypothetical protein
MDMAGWSKSGPIKLFEQKADLNRMWVQQHNKLNGSFCCLATHIQQLSQGPNSW